MITDVKPKQPIELPTQSPDDHILQQVNRRFARSNTPGLIERGLRGSSTAIAAGQGLSLEEQELAEQYKEENPNWIRDGVETLINMTASLPVFGAGTAAGTAALGPVGGAAGGFGLDTFVREVYQGYLQAVKRGETTLSFDDWMEVAKESGKSAALGGALAIASPFLKLATNNPVVGKLLKTPLSKAAADLAVEAGAFTVGGAAIGHGELSLEDFRDNLIAIGGMHLSQAAIKSLHKKHVETGKPPEQLLIEYKPKALETPITPEQKSEAERITKEKAPKEKEPEPSLEEKFKRGLKEIAGAHAEKQELERIEKGIKEIEATENEGFIKQLRDDIYKRVEALKKKRQDLTGKEQSELYTKAVKAKQKMEEASKKRAHAEELRGKEKQYAREGKEAKAKERIKERERGFEPMKKERMARETAEKKATVVERAKELQEELKESINEKARLLNEQKKSLREKIASTEPTPRQRFESEKEMNKPLSQRLGEVLADKEANVKRLYSQLNKSMAAKEPRPVKELIRKQIREIESEIKELNEAKQKREEATIEESANKIKKKKGSKKYVEETNRAADQIARDVLDKVSKRTDHSVVYEAIKKDLEPMGIKLRCL